MGSEPHPQENTRPTLSLFSLPQLQPHQQHSTNFTSPLHTSASVPFRWEEQPGKPLPCLALTLPTTKCLDLPPRLLNNDTHHKLSPTTVLDGPYNIGVKSYSCRFLRKTQGSFDGSLSLGGSSPEKGVIGPTVLSRSNSSRSRRYNKGLLSSWRIRGHNIIKSNKNEVNGGKLFSPDGVGTTAARDYRCIQVGYENDNAGTRSDTTTYTYTLPNKVKKGNFLGLSPVKSHFLAIYGAFKQVIPSSRRSTKWKKDVF